MNNKNNDPFFKLGITGAAVVLFGMFCFFVLNNFSVLTNYFSTIMKLLMPFLYGAVIAYLLAPLCNKFEGGLRKLFPKSKNLPGALSILLSLLLALLVIILLLVLVIPNVVQSIFQIIDVLPGQMKASVKWLHNLLETYPELQDSWDNFSSEAISRISSWLETDLLTTVQSLISVLGVQFAGLVTLFKNLFLGLLISIYLLASRKNFARQARMLLAGIFPRKWATWIEEEVLFADRMLNGFLVGRILDSAIIGLICFIFTMICGFDSAVLVSVVVGVTNIIPVFGPLIGAVPCLLILLLQNPVHALIFLVFIVILQQLDGNVIGPRILGETTGVSSFWVLFSVLFFGGLWGVPGMIIGVPLFAVLYDILRRLVYRGLRRHGRMDLMAAKADQDERSPLRDEGSSAQDESTHQE